MTVDPSEVYQYKPDPNASNALTLSESAVKVVAHFPAQTQTTADRLAGINRCLDALEVVVTCLKHTESGRQAQHKAACEEHLKNLKAALHSWADYERDRLT